MNSLISVETDEVDKKIEFFGLHGLNNVPVYTNPTRPNRSNETGNRPIFWRYSMLAGPVLLRRLATTMVWVFFDS